MAVDAGFILLEHMLAMEVRTIAVKGSWIMTFEAQITLVTAKI